MANLDTILENISEYENNVQDLVKSLRDCGINSFDDFKELIRNEGIPVKRAMQNQIQEAYDGSEDDEWADACNQNTIDVYRTYIQNYPDGTYVSEAREKIASLMQRQSEGEIDSEWEAVDKSDINALTDFNRRHPNSAYYNDALKLIRKIREEELIDVDIHALELQIKAIHADKSILDKNLSIYQKVESYIRTGKITTDDLLNAIRDNNNFLSSKVIKLLYDNGIINDFSATEIRNDFLSMMISQKPQEKFQDAAPIDHISLMPCTEVYFWGIPSSGKTCALGAILSTLNDGETVRSTKFERDCQGYGYMNRLSNVFQKNRIGVLPPGTKTTNTYEMGMHVEDIEKKVHPITCIDLAGELTRCMYKKDANEDLKDDEKSVLNTVTNILKDNRTDNRKIHFFVIEYGAEDRAYEGLPQRIYLSAALNYIESTGIFVKNTDAIFLLITKVDKINARGEELRDKLRSYIKENYLGFYNGLEKICRDHYINNGKVEIQPFSLGEVCMQDFCLFKNEYAAEVVRAIIKRSWGEGTGFMSKIRRSLKK